MNDRLLPPYMDSSGSLVKAFFVGWMNKKFLSEVLSIALPILVSNTINTSLQLVDQLMLASLGTKVLAAVTYVNLIYFFTGIVFFGIGSSCAIFFSRTFHHHRTAEINEVKAIGITIGWIFSIIMILVAEFYSTPLISLYTNDSEVISIGALFFHHIAYGQPFFAVAGVYIYLLRVAGFGKTAMMGSIIAFMTNTFLNYLLIFGHWGFPKLGVLGATIATNLARTNMMLYYIIRTRKLCPQFNLRWANFKNMTASLFKTVLKTSIVLILGDSLWSLSMNLYSSIFGHVSNEAAATYSIALMFRQITITVTFAITPAVLILMGKFIGNAHSTYAHLKYLAIKIHGFGFFISIGMTLLLLFFSPWLLGSFYGGSIPAPILHDANILVQILALLLPLMTANNFFGGGIFRAGGDTKINLIYIFLFNLCLSFPLAYYLGNLGYSVIIIFLGTYVGDIVRFLANIIHFMRGHWILSLKDSNPIITQEPS